MGKLLRLVLAIMVVAATVPSSFANIRYVKPAGAGNGSGTSWANASNNLHAMITASNPGDQVWIFAGHYQTSAFDQAISFRLKNGVALYGGFGSDAQTSPGQRIFDGTAANTSTLSGKIGIGLSADHVIQRFGTNVQLDNTTILDGFTITGGNADASALVSFGGGIYLPYNSSPTIRNCRFIDNKCAFAGGAIAVMGGNPTIENCVFENNTATFRGDDFFGELVNPVFRNCGFYSTVGNTSILLFPGSGYTNTQQGSFSVTMDKCRFTVNNLEKVYSYIDANSYTYQFSIDFNITNCVFNNLNTSSEAVIGLGGRVPDIKVINCTFRGNNGIREGSDDPTDITNLSISNTISWGGNMLFWDNSIPTKQKTFSNNIIKGGLSACTACPAGSGDIDPLFVNIADPDGADNKLGTADDGLRLSGGSPALNTGLNGQVTDDVTGAPRQGNTDIGAYEGAVCPAGTLPRFYVNASVIGGNNSGNNWSNAISDLSRALAIAGACNTTTEIWVAQGTYYPTSTSNRAISFALKEGVAIYGGFAGNETQRSQRNWKTNPTILSGEINKDGALTGNSYHVIQNDINNGSLTESAILDGFTITGGNANGVANNDKYGGGLFNYSSSPSIVNCRFTNNSASTGGGGIYNNTSSPRLTNCSFDGNRATSSGIGGGVLNNNSSPQVINCSFGNNSASSNGGGMYNNSSSNPSITNSIFWGNTGGQIFNVTGSTPAITYCIVQGGNTANGNLNTDPLFEDAANGNLRLKAGSPATNTGLNTANTETFDLDHNPRIVNGTIDRGAYEKPAVCNPSGIVYVNAAATPGGDGSSWETAFTKLQDALANTCQGVTQVWVAKGTYYPDEGGGNIDNDPNASFLMRSNLAIYGGFSGGELNLTDRNWKTNVTTLSGDVGVANSFADNSYNVVTSINNNDKAILNGFTITLGVARNPGQVGAGLYSQNSSCQISNCNFFINVGGNTGAAIFFQGGNPVVSNCSFGSNQISNGAIGGAIYNAATKLVVINSIFTGNDCIALYSDAACDVVNCSFSGNNGDVTITNSNNASMKITNSIIWGNKGAIQNYAGSSLAVSYSIVQGTSVYPGQSNLLANPMFVQQPPIAWLSTGNLRLKAGSPAINTGLNSANTLATDLDANPRIVNSIIDRGAYETPAVCPADGVMYVDSAAAPGGDGSTWVSAFSNLQDALASTCSNLKEIWVAKGTYYPDEGGGKTNNDRTASFTLKTNLAIYGGFAGTETNREQRNWKINPTILSGDIDKNGNSDEYNSNYIIYNSNNNLTSSAIIDGFTITAGNSTNLGSTGHGAGMFNHLVSPTISNCNFVNNISGASGGGMYNFRSSPRITNCIFAHNTCTVGTGGGLYNNQESNTEIINCSFANNSSEDNGSALSNGSNASLIITNSIIWGNNGVQVSNSGTININYSIIQGGYTGTGNLNMDPLFVDAANDNLRLQITSPAINKGLNSANTLTTDLDGNARIMFGTIDIGAYESLVVCPSGGILYVNATATGANNGITWADAYTNLQDALANACPGVAQIWVAKGTYYPDEGGTNTDNNRNAYFKLKNNLAIYGGFAGNENSREQRNWKTNPTVLSGDIDKDNTLNGNSYHIIYNDIVGIGLNNSAVLDGFTITGGYANGGNNNDKYGGGLYNYNCSPSVTNCSFLNNSVTMAGAGVYNNLSSPIFTNCSFAKNAAAEGGAIYNNNNSSPVITNCSVSNNAASANGGGVGNSSSSPAITNSIIWGNTGGQVYYTGGTPTITYSIVQGGYTGASNSDADPLFVDAANGNLRLQACSPAINMGSDAANSQTIDLDGNSRKFGTIDMGAYERQTAIPTTWYLDITATGNGDGTSWTNAFTSLTTALQQFNACSVSNTLMIAKGTYSGTPPFEFDKLNATILGGFPSGGGTRNPANNPVIIQGDVKVLQSLQIDGVKVQKP